MLSTCNILYLVKSYLHVLYQTIISYDIYLYIFIHMHISIHIHISFITYHLYIPIACQSFPLHVLCLWHISYLYFYCIPFFYTLHIPYSFYDLLLSMFYYIFFHILLYFYILSILFMSSYTVFLVLVTVYYHHIAMLCFSYHIIYFIHFLYLYFSFSFMFMPANTLAADTGNNCMYPKVLSLYETVISICIYPKVSSLYETMTYAM